VTEPAGAARSNAPMTGATPEAANTPTPPTVWKAPTGENAPSVLNHF
jgi:hypothetical protein